MNSDLSLTDFLSLSLNSSDDECELGIGKGVSKGVSKFGRGKSILARVNREIEISCKISTGNSDNQDTDTDNQDTADIIDSRFWLASDSDDDDSDTDEEDLYDNFEVSLEEFSSVHPSPSFGGVMLLPVKEDEEELASGHLRAKATRALDVYNKQEGSDYEYVSTRGLTPTRSPEDHENVGHHMNFWAKLEGSDDSELFFSSVSYDDVDDIHCCKLDSSVAETPGMKHCEHIDCSECALWAAY